jgi:CheY-like chemotaxis protein
MKIIVVDDHVAAEVTINAALTSDPVTENIVTGVTTPDALGRRDDLNEFDVAFVDLDFRRQSEKSGLFALRLLQDAKVPAVIYTADDEDNRVLFLLAAFQFYSPWALLSKRASSDEIRRHAAIIKSGAHPDSPAMRRYQPPPLGKPILNQLIYRASDLPIWRALGAYSDRNAVAEATHVSRSKVDSFLSDHSDVVAYIESELLLRTRPLPEIHTTRERAHPYAHRFAPLHSFAAEHHRFFADAEVEVLLEKRDRALLPPVAHRRSRRFR